MTLGVHPRGPVSGGPGPFRHAALIGPNGVIEITPSTGTAATRGTVSMWIKWVSRSDAHGRIYSVDRVSGAYGPDISYNNGAMLCVGDGTVVNNLEPFEDPTAWRFVHMRYDTSGVTVTVGRNVYTFEPWAAPRIGGAFKHVIGAFSRGGSPGNFYIAEFHQVVGQAIDADQFYLIDIYGRQVPRVPAGVDYGTNGAYLTFDDPLNLGKNEAGADWSVVGEVTHVADGPSINVATLNPLVAAAGTTLSNGNRTQTHANSTGYRPLTVYGQDGRYYGEVTVDSRPAGFFGMIGAVHRPHLKAAVTSGEQIDGYLWSSNGTVRVDTGSAGGYPTYDVGDRLMFALDLVEGRLFCGKNGDWLTPAGAVHTDLTDPATAWATDLLDRAEAWTMAVGASVVGVSVLTAHVAEEDLLHRPDGYKTFAAANLPAPVVNPRERFNAVTYAGDGTDGRRVLGVGHRPSALWFKTRNAGNSHLLYDVLRGVDRRLRSNETAAEMLRSGQLVSLDDDGFTVNNDTAHADLNGADHAYVAWSLYAEMRGALEGGTITATVAASECFSVVRYIGNGLDNQTVGHGLGGIDLHIHRAIGVNGDWYVGAPHFDQDFLILNKINAATSSNPGFEVFRSNLNTEDFIGLSNNSSGVNLDGQEYIAYCFRSMPGLCAVGTYIGNASAAGPFVYTGFRPRFLLTKRIDGISGWHMFDLARSPDGKFDRRLLADSPATEGIAHQFTVFSNGFQVTDSAAGVNQSGERYLYLAMADVPFSLA